MAKGTHNKTHKRNMSIIRKVMEEKMYGPMRDKTSARLFSRIKGEGDDSLISRKKSAFRYPNDPEAEYPQEKRPEYIDRRAMSVKSDYLVKMGNQRPKKQYMKERDERLRLGMLKAEGKLNEGKIIEVEDMDGLIEDINEMEVDEEKIFERKNARKNKGESRFNSVKDDAMDLEEFVGQRNRRKNKKKQSRSYRHHRKSKVLFNNKK